MDRARLFIAESIFNDLVGETKDQREATLAARCAQDDELRALVERLLANDRSGMGRFLREPAFSPSSAPDPEPPSVVPRRIGPYEIIRRIGEGGMGVVYEARQSTPRRTVALKVLRTALPSREILNRFRHEAQILAQLRHPGIAQIYEAAVADVTLDGGLIAEQPYFVMEFVDGRPPREAAETRRLGVRERLELIARICDAVQHAHEKGVIHRDLKPENLLVEHSGQPRILDFGVARLTNDQGETLSLQTRAGEIIGTLAYMSPEQLGADSARVDTRSDVYSLGVIAYELLAGRLPHNIRNLPLVEAARSIKENEPSLLSTVSRDLRGDPETIVAKAMQRDRDRRYESAASMAADIRRFLKDEPIEARRDSAVYMLGKTLRRYRWAIAASGVFVIGLALFAAYAAVQSEQNRHLADLERTARRTAEMASERALLAQTQERNHRTLAEESALKARAAEVAETEQRKLAQSEADHAQSVTRFLVEVLDLADPDVTQTPDLTVRQILERATSELDGAFADRPAAEATLRTVIGRAYAALGEPGEARGHLERAFDLQRRVLAARPAELYETLWPLSYVLTDLSDTLASSRESECARMGRQVLAESSPELAARLTDLANQMTGGYQATEADPVYAEIRRLAQELIPPGDERWIIVGDQLYFCGYWLGERRHPRPACDYLRRALEIHRRVLPETNTRIVRTLAPLMSYEVEAGRHDHAEQLALQSIELLRKTLPEQHWYVALSRARLGACLIGQDRFEEAEPLLLDGMKRVIESRGSAGRYVTEILRSLIRLYQQTGREDLAEARRTGLAEALAGSPERISWSAAPSALNSPLMVFGPRLAPLAQVLAPFEGPDGPDLSPEYAARVIELRGQLLADDHPIAAVLAELFQIWGERRVRRDDNNGVGQVLLEEAAQIARASPSLYGRKKADVWAWLAMAYRSSDPARSEMHYREALAILEQGFDTYAYAHWVESHLGGCLLNQERFEEAEPILLSGYAGLLEYSGAASGNTRGALHYLVELYDRWGQVDRLRPYAEAELRTILAIPDARTRALDLAIWRVVKYPDFPEEVYALARDAIHRTLEKPSDDRPLLRTLSAAQYRTGCFAEVIATLDKRYSTPDARDPASCIIAALVHADLGQTQEARAALQQAESMVAKQDRVPADLQMMLREGRERIAQLP